MAPPQLTDAELGGLQTHIYHLKGSARPKRMPRLLPDSAQGCPDMVSCKSAMTSPIFKEGDEMRICLTRS